MCKVLNIIFSLRSLMSGTPTIGLTTCLDVAAIQVVPYLCSGTLTHQAVHMSKKCLGICLEGDIGCDLMSETKAGCVGLHSDESCSDSMCSM